MKKIISYSIVLLLFVWVLGSCGNSKDATEGADKKDKAKTEKVQASDSDTEETQEEGTEEKVESHKGLYEPSELAKGWKQRTIAVKGKNSDIVALFEAFHNAWPTDAGSRIMHQASPKQYPAGELYEEGSIIDRKNGYVESAWLEGEDLGAISACVWNRKNGHKLLAVTFDNTDNNFICFYDFDPAKRTLTPEKSPIKKEHLNYPDRNPAWYTLPREGKRLEVVEDTPEGGVAVVHYDFDGQNLKFTERE